MRGMNEERVRAAVRKVPREEFVPEEFRAASYADRPLPIGYARTISQPFLVAFMTEELQLQPTDRFWKSAPAPVIKRRFWLSSSPKFTRSRLSNR